MSKLLKLNDMLKLNAVKLSLPPAHPARPTYADQKTLFVCPNNKTLIFSRFLKNILEKNQLSLIFSKIIFFDFSRKYF